MGGDARERLDTEVAVGGDSIPLTVVRHARARRITLRLESGRRAARVTVPPGMDLRMGVDFARSRRDWIGSRLARQPHARPFRHGLVIPYRGEDHVIFHLPGRRGTVWREGEGKTARICVAGAAEHLPRRLEDWLRKQAKKHLSAACGRYSRQMGLPYRRISVRDQKSRWGSCSSKGNLNFSWRLIFTPPFVLDYLAAHEVAHLAEMNHSPRFWALVNRHCPHVERAEEWLSAHGRDLHSWGADE